VIVDRPLVVRPGLILGRAAENRDDEFLQRLVYERTPVERADLDRVLRILDLLDAQLGLNQVNLPEAVRGVELLIRATPSLAFGLLRDAAFVDRFGAALRHLGLRGIGQRLDEVTHSVMAEPIPGPTAGRRHRDELPSDERVDAEGNPLPPLPGF